MAADTWTRISGMAVVADSGTSVFFGGPNHLCYRKDGRLLVLRVEDRLARDSNEPSHVTAIRIDQSMFWEGGPRISARELDEMKEALTQALPILDSRAEFVDAQCAVVSKS